MNTKSIELPSPKIATCNPKLIVGLSRTYTDETRAQMGDQWQAFQPHIGNIATQIGDAVFGVLVNASETGDVSYLTGAEVSEQAEADAEMDSIHLTHQTYAVFPHTGHVSQLAETWDDIFADLLPKADFEVVQAPYFERYGEDFDPQSGTGVIEIWIPIKP